MTLSTTKNIYDVKVESVKPCEDDENKVVVVLSCDRLDEALVESRVQSAELIFVRLTPFCFGVLYIITYFLTVFKNLRKIIILR